MAAERWRAVSEFRAGTSRNGGTENRDCPASPGHRHVSSNQESTSLRRAILRTCSLTARECVNVANGAATQTDLLVLSQKSVDRGLH